MTHGVDPARFTTPFPEYLRCARCKYVALPPRVICADEHLLCVPCLGDAREENPFPTCPSCRKRIRKNAPASCILERAIDSFMYTCKRSDCDWTGSIYDYSPHVRDECLFRPIPCRVCDHAVRFKDEADHIQKRCPLAVVKCPRRLCSSGGEIPRNEFAAHEKVCSMERCVVAGCPTRTTKANMPAHEAACMANVKLVERLKDEVRRLNKNIRERQDDEELLSEDDEWVDEDEEEEERYEEYEDEDDEESMDAVYTRLDKTLDDTIAWAAATKARQTPLAPIAAPAPTSSTSRTATAPFAQAPPSSNSRSAAKPFKVHVVDLEEGTDEMVEL
ncbi:hypothetical protein JCM8208_001514 [Rhodotorula glutinis]